jgi:hypothetical protein
LTRINAHCLQPDYIAEHLGNANPAPTESPMSANQVSGFKIVVLGIAGATDIRTEAGSSPAVEVR